jgi:hypothetical protein
VSDECRVPAPHRAGGSGARSNERFIGQALEPVASTFDTKRMAAGEPGLPREFTWQGERIRVVGVRREWRETGPCRHGSGEQYVRKHWYEVEDDTGRTLKIYVERHPRGRRKTGRWHLFSMEA